MAGNVRKPFGVRTLCALTCGFALLLRLSTSGAEVEFSILQTTDIHGFMLSSDRLEDGGGGWLRVATLIRREFERTGRDRVLLFDCGDTFSGTVDALASRGRLPLAMLELLDYDFWIIGNHELDFGVDVLSEAWKNHANRALAGNLVLLDTGEPRRFPDWRMVSVGEARIAVIGMTASYLDNWFWGRTRRAYRVSTASERLKEIMPAVTAAKPDAIVLAAHQGWLPRDPRGVNEIADLVRLFPQLDIVLGGHTHWPHSGRRIGDNTWYVQSGSHADAVAVLEVTVDTGQDRVVKLESKLVKADASIPRDPFCEEHLAPMLREAEAFRVSEVGVLARDLPAAGISGADSATAELLCKAIAGAVDVDAVVHGKLSNESLAKGTVTEADLFRIVPYENEIGVLTLTAEQIEEILEEQLAALGSSSAVCGPWGITVKTEGRTRVSELLDAEGNPLSGSLRVAFNSYTLAGGGGRFPRLRAIVEDSSTRQEETGVETREAVREYFRRHSPVAIDVTRWLVLD